MGKLDNKKVIITGSGKGIGEGISLKLAKEGAVLALTSLHEESVMSTFSEVKKISPESIAFQMDVTKAQEITDVVNKVIQRFGTIDILINNAGVSTMGRFTELSEEEWDNNMDVNIKGIWLVTKTVAPIMMKKKKGKIIMIASMAAKLGALFLSHYSASKFAVLGFAQSIAKELAEYNINVNSVCPGFVKTSMQNRELLWEAALRDIDSPETVKQEYIETTPLKRLCYPEDVANVVLFLASGDSDFMTGQALNVTGGICVY